MKNIILSFIFILMSHIVWAAKPNNVVPLGIFTETNGCMGMRLTKDIIITAAHCLIDITNVDSSIYLDFKYSDTAKELIVILSSGTPQGNTNGNADVYFHTQNFYQDPNPNTANRFGDLALIKIKGPINMISSIISNINVESLPPQIKNMMMRSLKNEQKKHNENYEIFMNIPLENYKVFALTSNSNKIPEFFKEMKVNSYVFPCHEDENHQQCLYREPPIAHTGKFKGIATRNPKIIGWNLQTQKGESGSPILDPENKRFFGAVSGPKDSPTEYITETMIIDENVCDKFLSKAGIKCEIANPPQPSEDKAKKQMPQGKNIEKPIIKPTRPSKK